MRKGRIFSLYLSNIYILGLCCVITTFLYHLPVGHAITSPAIDSRIKTLVYSPNEIYHLRFVVKYQSMIELEKDEEVELVTFGDPLGWTMKIVSKRIFLKPLDPGIKTNMTIVTNKRTYLLEIESTNIEDDYLDDQLTYVIRFFYPELNVDVPRPNNNSVSLSNALPKEQCPDGKCDNVMVGSENLNFRYSYAHNSERLIPLRVFDNERQTFLQFANANAIIPAVYAVNLDGTEVLLRPRLINEYVVVDTVEYQLALRYGKEIVCIFNERLLSPNRQIDVSWKKQKFRADDK